MKKVMQILSGSVLAIGLLVGSASADTTTTNCGNISNTGPDSNNTITCVDQYNNDVICNNNTVVEVSGSQTSNSGGAFTVDNTYSGSATSGSSDNSNVTNVSLGDSCAPVAVASVTTPATTTPVASTTTATPATTTPTPAVAPKTVAALPSTGSDSNIKYAGIGLAAVSALVIASQLSLSVYRRASFLKK